MKDPLESYDCLIKKKKKIDTTEYEQIIEEMKMIFEIDRLSYQKFSEMYNSIEEINGVKVK